MEEEEIVRTVSSGRLSTETFSQDIALFVVENHVPSLDFVRVNSDSSLVVSNL